jgi:hypothetical protein
MEKEKEFNCIFSSKDEKYNSYIISCKTLGQSFFRSWHLNRPSDRLRVNEIRNYLLDNKPEKIDGEIFAAEIESEWNKGNVFYEIYDGNHRREAIISGFSDLYPDTKVIVSVIKVKNDIELLEYFRRINKMVPLSEADLIGDPDIQTSLHKIAKDYCHKYPQLVKTTTRPHRPNFNRDDFVDSLYKIYIQCKMNTSSQLTKVLEDMNNYIKKTFESLITDTKKTKTIDGLTVTQSMYNTANKHGLYLFLCKDLVSDIGEFYDKEIH